MLTLFETHHRVVLLSSAAVIVLLSVILAVQAPVVWATPPQDRAHQTAPLGALTLCQIGPNIGITTCYSPLRDFWITFPADVVSKTLTIDIRLPTGEEYQQTDAGYLLVGHTWFVEAIDDVGNTINPVYFNQPSTVCVTYTDDDLKAAGGEPRNFVHRFFNTTANNWESLPPVTVDVAKNQVCTSLTHLTLFSLFTGEAPAVLPGVVTNQTPTAVSVSPVISQTTFRALTTENAPTTLPETGGTPNDTPVLMLWAILGLVGASIMFMLTRRTLT